MAHAIGSGPLPQHLNEVVFETRSGSAREKLEAHLRGWAVPSRLEVINGRRALHHVYLDPETIRDAYGLFDAAFRHDIDVWALARWLFAKHVTIQAGFAPGQVPIHAKGGAEATGDHAMGSLPAGLNLRLGELLEIAVVPTAQT